jgi:hypothetical protein
MEILGLVQSGAFRLDSLFIVAFVRLYAFFQAIGAHVTFEQGPGQTT